MTIATYKKLPIQITDDLINAFWNIKKTYEEKFINQTTWLYGNNKNDKSIDVYSIQIIGEKYQKILEKQYGDKWNIEAVDRNLYKNWVFYDENIKVVEDFLNQNFTSASQLRIDILHPSKILSWHSCHPRPRVFIPLHKNSCEFKIKDKNGTHSLYLSLIHI